METAIVSEPTWQVWKESKRVSAVAVYEDSSTRGRVEDFCRALARDLGPNCQLATESWPVSELRMPQLRTIAADEAARADLIIIALHHAETLPDEISSWNEAWLKKRSRNSSVLLAIFDPLYQGSSGSLRTTLQGVADKGRMSFLVQTDEAPEERS
jgi:hypothetical protein